MTRKRLKKLLMAVQGIERDKAEVISRTPYHKFREVIAAEARRDVLRQKERSGRP
ncbi:MAG: hypothetical protein IJV51_04365 [Oscillospiraceae bacterium]|nr:hypothetical protein [Oscillospiraceae bacterium]